MFITWRPDWLQGNHVLGLCFGLSYLLVALQGKTSVLGVRLLPFGSWSQAISNGDWEDHPKWKSRSESFKMLKNVLQLRTHTIDWFSVSPPLWSIYRSHSLLPQTLCVDLTSSSSQHSSSTDSSSPEATAPSHSAAALASELTSPSSLSSPNHRPVIFIFHRPKPDEQRRCTRQPTPLRPR
jgi:hypothetical protein